jgi:hypothetical protein
MPTKNEKLEFPNRHPIKKMREVIEAEEIQNVQLTSVGGDVLAELPVRVSPRKIIPGVFKIPAQTIGVGISTVARLLGLGVAFKTGAVEKETDDG